MTALVIIAILVLILAVTVGPFVYHYWHDFKSMLGIDGEENGTDKP